jgi:hypothetical protein
MKPFINGRNLERKYQDIFYNCCSFRNHFLICRGSLSHKTLSLSERKGGLEPSLGSILIKTHVVSSWLLRMMNSLDSKIIEQIDQISSILSRQPMQDLYRTAEFWNCLMENTGLLSLNAKIGSRLILWSVFTRFTRKRQQKRKQGAAINDTMFDMQFTNWTLHVVW